MKTNSLYRLLCLAACAVFFGATPAQALAQEASPTHIVLAGDSTVTDEVGWGKAFAGMLTPDVRCTNTARGGQSTKSFLDAGLWAKALALHPTYVMIQFGHNDMPGKGPNRETDPKTVMHFEPAM